MQNTSCPGREASDDEFKRSKSKWEDGIGFELEFWKRWIETRGDAWKADFENRFRKDTPFILTSPLAGLNLTSAKILDVGAGPVTMLGLHWPDVELSITALDPLADEYNRMMDEAGIKPIVRTRQGAAETLHELFEPNTFDAAHSRNALDHCKDPYLGVIQMLRVVKVGHPVILAHYDNEAEREAYSGFHQWNFHVVDGEFLIWRPDINFNVTKQLAAVARTEAVSQDNFHSVMLWKTADVTIPEQDRRDDEVSDLSAASVTASYISQLEREIAALRAENARLHGLLKK